MTREPFGRRMTALVITATLFSSCLHRRAESHHHSEKITDMTDDLHSHHAIDYIEISVTDMVEAKRFYKAAFDWQFSDYGPDYAGIQKQGGEAGGLCLVPEVSTGGPLVILYSENLDTSLAAVRDAGGRISTEPFEFPGGRRFHFQDPSGNELAVWSTSEPE